VKKPECLGHAITVQALGEAAVRHPAAGQIIRPVPDRLTGKHLMDLSMKGQQAGGDGHAEEKHAFGTGKGSQHIQLQHGVAAGQKEAKPRQIRTVQGLTNGQ
jgi:hypothetical protein